MFSQLVFVRLKAAENALRDGRLDEAYRLATADDLRSHRRATAVLATLAEKYLERARGHFREDRFREAMLDLDRAGQGGVLAAEIAELRKIVQTVASEQDRKEELRRGLLRDAARRIETGSLAAGRRILEQASESDPAAADLKKAIDRRVGELAALLGQVERLLGQGQLAACAERIAKAKSMDAHAEGISRLESQLCEQVCLKGTQALQSGKLSRGAAELAALGELGRHHPGIRELSEAIVSAQEAGQCIREHRYSDARRHVLGLDRKYPNTDWIVRAAEQLRVMEETETTILAGPLGDSSVKSLPSAMVIPSREANLEQTIALAVKPRLSSQSNGGLLLLVDGGGSYLILRQDRVAIGRAAADYVPDIPILSDLAERHAEIARMDEDYFLFSSKDVEVGGRATRHQLLKDGDRLVFGRKGKMNFRLPSRQSPSAILELSDTTKMPNDVRRVVLFHQHAMLGNHAGAHINCRHAGTNMVLFERNGSLWLRARSDGHTDQESKMLALGQSVEMGGVRLALEPWQVRGLKMA